MFSAVDSNVTVIDERYKLITVCNLFLFCGVVCILEIEDVR